LGIPLKRNYEVIVVGAGPAGATAAYELAIRGVTVLLLDKAIFPRHKCCGGGLSVKAAGLLGNSEVVEVVEDSISSLLLTFAGADYYRGEYGKIIMYTVTRERFDHFLIQKAEEAGAKVLQGLAAGNVNLSDSGVEVVTSAGSFRSQFVVGADGNRGVVARSLNLKTQDYVVGIETEVLTGYEDLAKWKSQVVIDLGCISNGCAWLFPKTDHLSVGVVCLRAKAKDLKRAYWQFLNSLNLKHYTIAKWSADFIQTCAGQSLLTQGRVALLGDAAGLADPLTGEGIYHAILSARLVAPAIENALLNGRAELH
jgi:geranylgeranyl reductase family protein